MALCFWRHSHPDYQSDSQDPVLSEWGHVEALRAAKAIRDRVGKSSIKIVSSPMKRCQQTANALARIFEVSVEENTDLRLKDNWESGGDFKERLDRIHGLLRPKDPNTVWVLCSHSDVLAYFLNLFGGPRLEIGKANFFWVADGRVKEVNPL